MQGHTVEFSRGLVAIIVGHGEDHVPIMRFTPKKWLRIALIIGIRPAGHAA